MFIKDPSWGLGGVKGRDVFKVHINDSVPTRIIMIITMYMYKERAKKKIQQNVHNSLSKGHIGIHRTFLATSNLVWFPNKK